MGRALRCALATALLHIAGRPGASCAPPDTPVISRRSDQSVAVWNRTHCRSEERMSDHDSAVIDSPQFNFLYGHPHRVGQEKELYHESQGNYRLPV